MGRRERSREERREFVDSQVELVIWRFWFFHLSFPTSAEKSEDWARRGQVGSALLRSDLAQAALKTMMCTFNYSKAGVAKFRRPAAIGQDTTECILFW